MTDDDIRHAVGHALRTFTDQGDLSLVMVIGPARNGAILEVGVLDDEDPRIVHAQQARRRFWP